MAQINLTVTIPNDLLDQAWGGDMDEFAASVKATLHEVIGDDGGPVQPKVAVTGTSRG